MHVPTANGPNEQRCHPVCSLCLPWHGQRGGIFLVCRDHTHIPPVFQPVAHWCPRAQSQALSRGQSSATGPVQNMSLIRSPLKPQNCTQEYTMLSLMATAILCVCGSTHLCITSQDFFGGVWGAIRPWPQRLSQDPSSRPRRRHVPGSLSYWHLPGSCITSVTLEVCLFDPVFQCV